MSRIRISAGIRVPDNKSPEKAKAELLKLASQTINEPNCYQFDVLQHRNDPRQFTLWECFEDEAAVTFHFDQSYTKQYIKEGWTEIQYSERLNALTIIDEV